MANKIGRKIYFDLVTGNVILSTSERQGDVRATTVEQDIGVYKPLSERNRDTFDVLELAFGEYAQDFAESAGYRVNTETRKLEFAPRTDDPGAEPEYQQPLSEQLKVMDQRVAYTEEALLVLMDMGVM